MIKLHKFCIVFFALLLMASGGRLLSIGQVGDVPASPVSKRLFCVQVAASRVYVEPEYFRKSLNLSEDVRYFIKNGWYKYIVGSCKTEEEAARKLTELNIKGFVTSYDPDELQGYLPDGFSPVPSDTNSLAQQPDSMADSSRLTRLDQRNVLAGDQESRRRYNKKIREADSAFNIARNYLLARNLYLEATGYEPAKNYPKDQIVEIDKLLSGVQSPSIFSRVPLMFYIAAGVIIVVIFLLSAFYFIRIRKKKQLTAASADSDENQKSEISLIPGYSAGPVNEISESVTERQRIEDCLNSADVFLRLESELALMRLNTEDPFSFLEKLRQDFTPLEQLYIFEWIKHNQIMPPDFSRWLNSPNESVVLFSKRMIIAFEQYDDYPVDEDDRAIFVQGPVEVNPVNIQRGLPVEDIQSVALRILDQRLQK